MSARNSAAMIYGRSPISLEPNSRPPLGSSSSAAPYAAPLRMFSERGSSGLEDRSHPFARPPASQRHPAHSGTGARSHLPYGPLDSSFIPAEDLVPDEGLASYGESFEPHIHRGLDRRPHDHYQETEHTARAARHARQNRLRSSGFSSGGDMAGLGGQDCSLPLPPEQYLGEGIAPRSMYSGSDLTQKFPFEMGFQNGEELRGSYSGLGGEKQQQHALKQKLLLQQALVCPDGPGSISREGRSSHHLPRVVEPIRGGGLRSWSPPLRGAPVMDMVGASRQDECLAMSPTGLCRDDVPPLMMSPLRREDVPCMMMSPPPRRRDDNSRHMGMSPSHIPSRRDELCHSFSPPPPIKERSLTPSPRRRGGGYAKAMDCGERQHQQQGRRHSPPLPAPSLGGDVSMFGGRNFPVVNPRRGAPFSPPRSPPVQDRWNYESLRFNRSPPPPPPPPPLTMPMSPRWDFPSRSLLWNHSQLDDGPNVLPQWDVRDFPPRYNNLSAGEEVIRKMGRNDDIRPCHPDQISIFPGFGVEGPSQGPGVGWPASARRGGEWRNGEGLTAAPIEQWLPHTGGWDLGAHRSSIGAHASMSHTLNNPRAGGGSEHAGKFAGRGRGRGRGRGARIVERTSLRGEQKSKGISKEKVPSEEHHDKRKDTLEAAIEKCKVDGLSNTTQRRASSNSDENAEKCKAGASNNAKEKTVSNEEGTRSAPVSASEKGERKNSDGNLCGGTQKLNESTELASGNLQLECSVPMVDSNAAEDNSETSGEPEVAPLAQTALPSHKLEEATDTETTAVSTSVAGTEQTEPKVAISNLRSEEVKKEADIPEKTKVPEEGKESQVGMGNSATVQTDQKEGASGPKRTSLVMEIERAKKSRRLAAEQRVQPTNHDKTTGKFLQAGQRLNKLNRVAGVPPPHAARRTFNEDNYLKRKRQPGGQGGSYRLVPGK